jgi:hypothetical protein
VELAEAATNMLQGQRDIAKDRNTSLVQYHFQCTAEATAGMPNIIITQQEKNCWWINFHSAHVDLNYLKKVSSFL